MRHASSIDRTAKKSTAASARPSQGPPDFLISMRMMWFASVAPSSRSPRNVRTGSTDGPRVEVYARLASL
jgi:hypothetical protein